MKKVAFLRGVMPSGPNSIPKMAVLADVLTTAGLKAVKTYIQSGNIVFETDLSDEETRLLVHNTIKANIGADLAVILKNPCQLARAVRENPFDERCDPSRVHLVWTNDDLSQELLRPLVN